MPKKKYIKNVALMREALNELDNLRKNFTTDNPSVKEELENIKKLTGIVIDDRDFLYYIALKAKTVDREKIKEYVEKELALLKRNPFKALDEYLNNVEKADYNNIDTSEKEGCIEILLRQKLCQLNSKLLADNPEYKQKRFEGNEQRQKYFDLRMNIELGFSESFRFEVFKELNYNLNTFRTDDFENSYSTAEKESINVNDSFTDLQNYLEGKKDYLQLEVPEFLCYQDDLYKGKTIAPELQRKYGGPYPITGESGFFEQLSTSIVNNTDNSYGKLSIGVNTLSEGFDNVYIDGVSIETMINNNHVFANEANNNNNKKVVAQKILADAVLKGKAIDVVGTKYKEVDVKDNKGKIIGKNKQLVHEIIPVSFKLDGENKKRRDEEYVKTHYSKFRRWFDFWIFKISRNGIEEKLRAEHSKAEDQNARYQRILNHRNSTIKEALERRNNEQYLAGDRDVSKITNLKEFQKTSTQDPYELERNLDLESIGTKSQKKEKEFINDDEGQSQTLDNKLLSVVRELESFLNKEIDNSKVHTEELKKYRNELLKEKLRLEEEDYEEYKRLDEAYKEKVSHRKSKDIVDEDEIDIDKRKQLAKAFKNIYPKISDKELEEKQNLISDDELASLKSKEEIIDFANNIKEVEMFDKLETRRTIINNHIQNVKTNAEIKRLETEIDDLNKQIEAEKAIGSALKKKHKTSTDKKEQEELNSQMAVQMEKINRAKANIDKIKQQINDIQAERNEGIQNEKNIIKQRIDELKARKTAIDNEIKSFGNKNLDYAAEERFNSLNEEYAKSENLIEKLQKKHDDLEKGIGRKEEQQKEKAEEILDKKIYPQSRASKEDKIEAYFNEEQAIDQRNDFEASKYSVNNDTFYKEVETDEETFDEILDPFIPQKIRERNIQNKQKDTNVEELSIEEQIEENKRKLEENKKELEETKKELEELRAKNEESIKQVSLKDKELYQELLEKSIVLRTKNIESLQQKLLEEKVIEKSKKELEEKLKDKDIGKQENKSLEELNAKNIESLQQEAMDKLQKRVAIGKALKEKYPKISDDDLIRKQKFVSPNDYKNFNSIEEIVDYIEAKDEAFKNARQELKDAIIEKFPGISSKDLDEKQSLISDDEILFYKTVDKNHKNTHFMLNDIEKYEKVVAANREKLTKALKNKFTFISKDELAEKQSLIPSAEIKKPTASYDMLKSIEARESLLEDRKEQIDLSAEFEEEVNNGHVEHVKPEEEIIVDLDEIIDDEKTK